jgi:hypothetical protein
MPASNPQSSREDSLGCNANQGFGAQQSVPRMWKCYYSFIEGFQSLIELTGVFLEIREVIR